MLVDDLKAHRLQITRAHLAADFGSRSISRFMHCAPICSDRPDNGTPQPPADFSVGIPIPKSVFEGRAQSSEAARYTVIERPPIRFRKPPSVH
jgi:hypothetical protein